MAQVTECSEPDCSKRAMARDLCSGHYSRKRRSGELVELAPRHRLTNVNLEAKVADCSICGPNVAIKLRGVKGQTRCRRSYLNTKKPAGRKLTPEARREYNLRTKYGITEADYLNMLSEQNGRCAVCELPSTGRLCVDHDHATGKVRGLLCRPCNLSLGYLRDDPFSAVSAAKYLMRITHRADT